MALSQTCRRFQALALPIIWEHVGIEQVWELGRLRGKLRDVPSRALLVRSFAWKYKWAIWSSVSSRPESWNYAIYDYGGPDVDDAPAKKIRGHLNAAALEICFAPRFGPDFYWHSYRGSKGRSRAHGRGRHEVNCGEEPWKTGWVDGILMSKAQVEDAAAECLSKMKTLGAFMWSVRNHLLKSRLVSRHFSNRDSGFSDSAIPKQVIDALGKIATLQDFFWDPCQIFEHEGRRDVDEAPIWEALQRSCPRRLTLHLKSRRYREEGHPESFEGYVEAAVKTIEAATSPYVRLTHLELCECGTDDIFQRQHLARSWVHLRKMIVSKSKVRGDYRPFLRAAAALGASLRALQSHLDGKSPLTPEDLSAHLLECAVDGIILPEGACLQDGETNALLAFSPWLESKTVLQGICDAFNAEAPRSYVVSPGRQFHWCASDELGYGSLCAPTFSFPEMRSIVSVDDNGRPMHSKEAMWRDDYEEGRVELDRFQFVDSDEPRSERYDWANMPSTPEPEGGEEEDENDDICERIPWLDLSTDFPSGLDVERDDYHFQYNNNWHSIGTRNYY